MKEASGWKWLPLTAGVILLDQLTKLLIIDRFEYAQHCFVHLRGSD